MPKKPMFIISAEGKSEEQIVKEALAAYEKFIAAMKKTGLPLESEKPK